MVCNFLLVVDMAIIPYRRLFGNQLLYRSFVHHAGKNEDERADNKSENKNDWNPDRSGHPPPRPVDCAGQLEDEKGDEENRADRELDDNFRTVIHGLSFSHGRWCSAWT